MTTRPTQEAWLRACVDEGDVVHALKGSDTWCGQAQSWKGGRWPIIKPIQCRQRLITCLWCVAAWLAP